MLFSPTFKPLLFPTVTLCSFVACILGNVYKSNIFEAYILINIPVVSVSSKTGTHHSSENWKPSLFLGDFLTFWPFFTVKQGDFRDWNDPLFAVKQGNFRPKKHFSQKNKAIKVLIWQMILKHRTLKLVNIMSNQTLLCDITGNFELKHPPPTFVFVSRVHEDLWHVWKKDIFQWNSEW